MALSYSVGILGSGAKGNWLPPFPDASDRSGLTPLRLKQTRLPQLQEIHPVNPQNPGSDNPSDKSAACCLWRQTETVRRV